MRRVAHSWEVLTLILGFREMHTGNTVAAVTVLTDRSGPKFLFANYLTFVAENNSQLFKLCSIITFLTIF